MAGRKKKSGQARKKSTGRGADRRFGDSALGRFFHSFAFGREVHGETAEHLQEIKGLLLIGISMWLLLALSSFHEVAAVGGANLGGQVGWYLGGLLFSALGWSGYLIVFLGAAWGTILVARKRIAFPALRVFGALCFLFSAAFLFELGFGSEHLTSSSYPHGPGGYVAHLLVGPVLIAKFGGPGLWILMILAALVSFMLATEMAFYPSFVAFGAWLGERRKKSGEGSLRAVFGWVRRLGGGLWEFLRHLDLERVKPAPDAAQAVPVVAVDEGEGLFDQDPEQASGEPDAQEEETPAAVLEEGPFEEEESPLEEEPVKPPPALPISSGQPISPSLERPEPPAGPWKFPPLELLEAPKDHSRSDETFIEQQARKLENALGSFRVQSTVVGAKVGATVTLFELEVSQGTRMNKVTQLSQEIAAALRAKSVRIIAPIPGKSTIGIEVPNEQRRLVRLSELVVHEAYDPQFMALPLFLGIDSEGNPVVEDLARMPHLLIAGTTGSGKSVCINTILASLLLTRSPHDVQMILVDPKMVELQAYSNIPHMMLPVVTDMKQATNVLNWAVEKMEGRYDLFRNAGVKSIKAYNALGEEGLRKVLGDDFREERTPRHVPYIVIVIDEMADLMMTSKKEAESAITRLAQKSRAVGIHVIVATQRPSTDVITGVIKGNLPTRIAFQVASKVDSRVILDAMGAEKLLGSGDMLYTPPQSSLIQRLQGALVEDHEIDAIVNFVCTDSVANFNQELVQSATGATRSGGEEDMAAQDELWDEAVRVILKSRRGSASLLQRALGIGYTRASRLIDMMTDAGIVGAYKGSKAREVLVTLEDWEQEHGAPLGHGAIDD